MPRLKKMVSYEQECWERELRERYGGMMTLRQIGLELGHGNNYRWLYKWTADMRSYGDGIRKRYRVSDVAERIVSTM